MVTVAALCVTYGLLDGALFALLPFDVTDGAAVERVYETYTVSHVVEGVLLGVLGLVGFYLTKKPLSKLGRVPDVDALYNPAVFYRARGLVVGVTELYAAVDRAAVGLARLTARIVTDPQAAARRAGTDADVTFGIGRSVLVLTLSIGVVLLAFLLV